MTILVEVQSETNAEWLIVSMKRVSYLKTATTGEVFESGSKQQNLDLGEPPQRNRGDKLTAN